MDNDNLSVSSQVLNYEEIMEKCRALTKERVAEVIKMSEPFMYSETGKILLEEQIYGIVIQMLSYCQATIYSSRRERQRLGIESAKAKGIHLGRRAQFSPENYIDIFQKEKRGEMTSDEVVAFIGSGKSTYYKIKRQLRKDGFI